MNEEIYHFVLSNVTLLREHEIYIISCYSNLYPWWTEHFLLSQVISEHEQCIYINPSDDRKSRNYPTHSISYPFHFKMCISTIQPTPSTNNGISSIISVLSLMNKGHADWTFLGSKGFSATSYKLQASTNNENENHSYIASSTNHVISMEPSCLPLKYKINSKAAKLQSPREFGWTRSHG
jgi:hypothetical protein